VVRKEFSPEKNWEADDYKWVEFGDWPTPLHFGMKELLRNVGHKIEKYVDKIKSAK
jgi:hypothetical protein